MASSGFVADFARRPLGQKIGIFAGIAVLLGLLYYQFSFSKLRGDISEAEASRDDLVAREKSLKKDEKEYDDLQKQVEALKTKLNENDSALPTAAQLPAFFDMLNRKVGEAGVEVRSWQYENQVPVDDTIDKVPVTIAVQGTFYQIEKLFYLLYKVNQKEGDEGGPAPGAVPVSDQEKDRVLTVESLHIGEPTVRNNLLVLTATFRASTFRKEEAPPPAEKDKAKKPAGAATPAAGAGSGSASGTASGSAPSGLLGEPAKAQQKTDDAMKKDADRVKEGM